MASTFVVNTRSGNLTVRSEPEKDSKKIGSLPRGRRLTVVEFKGEWRKLSTGGWVLGDFLSDRLTPSAQSGLAKLPAWADLWKEYPNYVKVTSAKVKSDTGGSVDAQHLVNTCAIRLSRTLNYNGIPVPRNFPGLVTKKGGDGMRYAIRVREVRKWLFKKLGNPGFDMTKKEGDAFDKTKIESFKGIVGFDIRFKDATGHLDLWNGKTFSSELAGLANDYWTQATRIWIWKTG